MKDFEKQLNNYRLTTAEIFYHMPDYPKLIQSYVWQELDLAPYFPELKGFLDFWTSKLEAKLHSVRCCHAEIIKPTDWQNIDADLLLH